MNELFEGDFCAFCRLLLHNRNQLIDFSCWKLSVLITCGNYFGIVRSDDEFL